MDHRVGHKSLLTLVIGTLVIWSFSVAVGQLPYSTLRSDKDATVRWEARERGRIVFSADEDHPALHHAVVCVVDLNSMEMIALTDTASVDLFWDFQPQWSPDGHRVYFQRGGREAGLCAWDYRTGKVTNLQDYSLADRRYRFVSDSVRLKADSVFGRSHSESSAFDPVSGRWVREKGYTNRQGEFVVDTVVPRWDTWEVVPVVRSTFFDKLITVNRVSNRILTVRSIGRYGSMPSTAAYRTGDMMEAFARLDEELAEFPPPHYQQCYMTSIAPDGRDTLLFTLDDNCLFGWHGSLHVNSQTGVIALRGPLGARLIEQSGALVDSIVFDDNSEAKHLRFSPDGNRLACIKTWAAFQPSTELVVSEGPGFQDFVTVAPLGTERVEDLRWSSDGQWILLDIHALAIHAALRPGLVAVEVATGKLCVIPGKFYRDGEFLYPYALGDSFDWYDGPADD